MSKFMENIAERLELPAEALGSVPKMTLTGNTRLLIENHRGLLGYTEECLEVSGGRLRIRVRGEGLRLRAMDADSLLISGTIFGVDTE